MTYTEQNCWTPQQEEILRVLHKEKFSSRMISNKIPGKSRNAVIGKLHRLGLSSVRPKINQKKQRINIKIELEKLKQFTDEKNLFNYINENSVHIRLAQPHHCRWPLADHHCCGLKIELGSYCAGHALIAYQFSRDGAKSLEVI